MVPQLHATVEALLPKVQLVFLVRRPCVHQTLTQGLRWVCGLGLSVPRSAPVTELPNKIRMADSKQY